MSGYGFVIVTVREARELGADSLAPYVNLRIGSYSLQKGELSVVEKKRTAVSKGGNPVYNQNIGLELHYPLDACFLEIHVWHKNPFAPNESLGILHLPFKQLPLSTGDYQISKWYALDKSGSGGQILLVFEYHATQPNLQSIELTEYTKIINANDPQPIRFRGLHELVSLNKKRYHDKKFNLDLAYITDSIVAMGFPSEGVESMYRNPMKDCQDFFNSRHPGHYKVYNLCIEKTYPSSKFEKCASYPFYDHNVPSFETIFNFCLDCCTFLEEDRANVVVIHCKAGKGRTGLMICCLLMFLYGISYQESLDFYASRRTWDNEGVTIPSQRKWVYFYESIKDQIHYGIWQPDRPLKLNAILINSAPIGFLPRIVVQCPQHDFEFQWTSTKGKLKKQEDIYVDLSKVSVFVNRETKILFFDLEGPKKDKKPAFWFWFHTKFCPTDFRWHFYPNDVDKLKLPQDNATFQISLHTCDAPTHVFKYAKPSILNTRRTILSEEIRPLVANVLPQPIISNGTRDTARKQRDSEKLEGRNRRQAVSRVAGDTQESSVAAGHGLKRAKRATTRKSRSKDDWFVSEQLLLKQTGPSTRDTSNLPTSTKPSSSSSLLHVPENNDGEDMARTAADNATLKSRDSRPKAKLPKGRTSRDDWLVNFHSKSRSDLMGGAGNEAAEYGYIDSHANHNYANSNKNNTYLPNDESTNPAQRKKFRRQNLHYTMNVNRQSRVDGAEGDEEVSASGLDLSRVGQSRHVGRHGASSAKPKHVVIEPGNRASEVNVVVDCDLPPLSPSGKSLAQKQADIDAMLFHLTSYVPENSDEIVETRQDSLARTNFDLAGVRRTRERRRNMNTANNFSNEFIVRSNTCDDGENGQSLVIDFDPTMMKPSGANECNNNLNHNNANQLAAPPQIAARFSGRRKNNKNASAQQAQIAKLASDRSPEKNGEDHDRQVTASEDHRNRIDTILKDLSVSVVANNNNNTNTIPILYGEDYCHSPNQRVFSVEDELNMLENLSRRATEETAFSFDETTQSKQQSGNHLGGDSTRDSNSVSARLRRSANNAFNTEFRNVLNYIEKVDADQLIDLSFSLKEGETDNNDTLK